MRKEQGLVNIGGNESERADRFLDFAVASPSTEEQLAAAAYMRQTQKQINDVLLEKLDQLHELRRKLADQTDKLEQTA